MESLRLEERLALVMLNGMRLEASKGELRLGGRCLLAAQQLEQSLASGTPPPQGWTVALEQQPDRDGTALLAQVVAQLVEADLLDIIPALLACDLHYTTAGVSIQEYRTASQAYQREVEGLRAELLETGAVSTEAIALAWLLQQAGALWALFAKAEEEQVAARLVALTLEIPLAKALSGVTLKGAVARGYRAFLSNKGLLSRSPVGAGVVSRLPGLQRSESIFIETEQWFPNPQQRLDAVRGILESNGHICNVKRTGEVPLVELDNRLYELVPDAVRSRIGNIHGVRLRRYLG